MPMFSNGKGPTPMKAMFLGFAAAILIAVGAAAVLTTADHSSAQRYATPSARL